MGFQFNPLSGKFDIVNPSRVYWDTIVAPSGGDYTTLGDALAAGATNIFVKAGTYTETQNLVFPANCSVFGENQGSAIINLGDTYTAVINDFNTISGVTIQSSLTSGSVITFTGSLLAGANVGSSITNCIFQFTHLANPMGIVTFIDCTTTILGLCVMSDLLWFWGGDFSNELLFNGTVEVSTLSNIFAQLYGPGTGNTTIAYNINAINSTLDTLLVDSNASVPCTIGGTGAMIRDCAITLTSLGSIALTCSNSEISIMNMTGSATLGTGAAFNIISNSVFMGGLTINESDNSIIGCRVGSTTAGVAITIGAAAARTIISGVRCSGVTDNGTDSAVDYVVY